MYLNQINISEILQVQSDKFKCAMPIYLEINSHSLTLKIYLRINDLPQCIACYTRNLFGMLQWSWLTLCGAKVKQYINLHLQ